MHDFSMIFTKLSHLNKAFTKLLKTFMEQPFCDENFIDFYSYSHVTTQMTHIKFDYSKLLGQFVEQEEIDFMQAQVNAADEYLRKGTGPGSDFLGWLDLPENYDKEEFARIQKAAAKIQSDS